MRETEGKTVAMPAADTGAHVAGSRHLRQVRAANPSPMTGPGTTTFLLGEGAVTVIDPGPADSAHLAAILATLAPGERIETILITHPHLDHSALVPALKAHTGAQVLGFGPAGSGRSPLMRALVEAGLEGGGEGIDRDFHPDICLADGESLALPCGPIEVIHTPGHMGEHLCFGWGDTLFTGDHVMAWAPSLVSPPDGDMGAFMASLRRLLARQRAAGWASFRPCHGAAIEGPEARLLELIAHREAREAQVIAALAEGPADLAEVTARVYGQLAPGLMAAASRNALSHLADLIARGSARAAPWPSAQAIFTVPD